MREESILLGTCRVTVDPERARAYAREIGADGARVPIAYPAVWLTEPALCAPVRALCAERDVVPVHESQAFACETPLVAGQSYDLRVALRREETPSRLILDATVATPDGAPVAKIETVLRLVPRKAFGGGA